MIYFVQAAEGGAIKIGTTKCLTQRLGYLRCETGEDLRVLAVMDGGLGEEKSLHRRFAHLRIAKFALCERFHPESDLVNFIATSGRAWDGTDEAPVKPSPGTPIRVSDDFAHSLRAASSFERLSISGYTSTHLLPIVENIYKEAVIREAKRLDT